MSAMCIYVDVLVGLFEQNNLVKPQVMDCRPLSARNF